MKPRMPDVSKYDTVEDWEAAWKKYWKRVQDEEERAGYEEDRRKDREMDD